MDFAACLKNLNNLLKLMMPHPEGDQEVLANDDLRLIVIYLMPDVWQQEFKGKNDKNIKQMIRLLILTYFKSQQSFKDHLKHICKYEFYYA